MSPVKLFSVFRTKPQNILRFSQKTPIVTKISKMNRYLKKDNAFEIFKRHHLREYSQDCATIFKGASKRIFSGVFGSCFRHHFTI